VFGHRLTAAAGALTRRGLGRAARVALVVGTVLVAINQGPALLGGHWSPGLGVRVILTYAVPFLVSLHAAWRVLADRASIGPRSAVPFVTVDQMIQLDRTTTDDYGISLAQMMENAGRNLARLARDRFLDGRPQGKTVVLLVGRGNNGGGALAGARHLRDWGADVRVILAVSPERLAGAPAHQLSILRLMGVPI
jgi:hypothetical protein